VFLLLTVQKELEFWT